MIQLCLNPTNNFWFHWDKTPCYELYGPVQSDNWLPFIFTLFCTFPPFPTTHTPTIATLAFIQVIEPEPEKGFHT